MEKKYVVPDGMMEAASRRLCYISSDPNLRKGLEDALRWLSENPIVPSRNQLQDVESAAHHEPLNTTRWLSDVLVEWQRRMFLAPAPKVDPKKCPHRWQAKIDEATMERVIYCELCDWIYSREDYRGNR